MRLKLTVRSHIIVVDASINIDSIDIEYVSSVNMNYRKNDGGSAIIHPHYEKWVRNMLNTAREAAARAGPEKKPETSN